MIAIFTRERRKRHKCQRIKSYKDEDRDCSDASKSQEMPRIASGHLKIGDRVGMVFPQSLQKEPTLPTLPLLTPPDLGQSTFLLCEATQCLVLFLVALGS